MVTSAEIITDLLVSASAEDLSIKHLTGLTLLSLGEWLVHTTMRTSCVLTTLENIMSYPLSVPLKFSQDFLSSILNGTANLSKLKGDKDCRLVKVTSIDIQLLADKVLITLRDDDKEIGTYNCSVTVRQGDLISLRGLEMYTKLYLSST